MEVVLAAGIAAIAPTLTALAAWRSLYHRTNGSGPLAQKIDEQGTRIARIEERTSRTEERCGRMERYLASEARSKRPPR